MLAAYQTFAKVYLVEIIQCCTPHYILTPYASVPTWKYLLFRSHSPSLFVDFVCQSRIRHFSYFNYRTHVSPSFFLLIIFLISPNSALPVPHCYFQVLTTSCGFRISYLNRAWHAPRGESNQSHVLSHMVP